LTPGSAQIGPARASNPPSEGKISAERLVWPSFEADTRVDVNREYDFTTVEDEEPLFSAEATIGQRNFFNTVRLIQDDEL